MTLDKGADMIEITNDNIKEYVMLNGANDLMTSVSKGVHIFLLTKKKKLVGIGFTSMTRSDDKLAVTSKNDISFDIHKNCKLDTLLVLTSDGKYSLEYQAYSDLYSVELDCSCFFHDLNLIAGIPVRIINFKLGF